MPDTTAPLSLVLSFDVEEHYRIEAAAKLHCPQDLKADYADRMERTTRLLLERLASVQALATFYVVGEIAETHPKLIRDIAAAGHEIGTHSHDHRRVHRFTPQTFREDLRRSIDALEQAAQVQVVGYRAPTFSVVRQTAWAIDVMAEVGLRYDSSVFPVVHDRYGIPDAPRSPFVAVGYEQEMLELPMATYNLFGQNLPVAGGGYFRLFPLALMKAGLAQLARTTHPAVGMLYFHPWEFDPTQPKLPLGWLSKWRTYVGIGKSLARLDELLRLYRFRRACDVARELDAQRETLPRFQLASEPQPVPLA